MSPTGVRVSDWLVVPRPRREAVVRLICLPHGGTAAFWPWADRLPPEIEVGIVQLPGREARLREPAFERMDELVACAADELSPVLSSPFTLFGHSIGALLAYELALALERAGLPAAALIVAGQNCPIAGSSGSSAIGQELPPAEDLTDDNLLAQLRELGGTPDGVLDDPELIALLLPAFRADAELVRSYRPSEDGQLACPVVAYGGLEDALADRAGLQRWEERTTAGCRVRMFPGEHFFIETARDLVLEALSADAFRAATR